MWRLLALIVLWPIPAQADPACGRVEFDGTPFTTCRITLADDPLRLWLRDETGAPYGSFRQINRALADQGLTLGVAMNGGMYHADRAPVGLYIENGKEEMRVITSEGPGNFGLLPNGVFCAMGNRAAVVESRSFAEKPEPCEFATQSGPMLVIDGELHPRFLEDGTSKYIRNGVGVSENGHEVVFAISDRPVNFHQFGRLFRDELQTPNALFLDGNISRLHAPSLNRSDGGFPMGPILGTVRPLD
nr:phosphodiester glycosidase family protein [Oceaniglobus ichthyenteri]